MEKLPDRIRLDPAYPIAVGGAGAVALLVGAFLPESYAIGCAILGVLGLGGAAYMSTLDVALFTEKGVVIGGTLYPFAEIDTVETHEGEVTSMRANGTPYKVIQSSLILHPPGGGAPRHVDIKNARGGSERVAETLRAHLRRYQADAAGS